MKKRSRSELHFISTLIDFWLSGLVKLSLAKELPWTGGTAETRFLENKGELIFGSGIKPDILALRCDKIRRYDLSHGQRKALILTSFLSEDQRIALSVWPFFKNKTKPKTLNRYRRADIPEILKALFDRDWSMAEYSRILDSAYDDVLSVAEQAGEKTYKLFFEMY